MPSFGWIRMLRGVRASRGTFSPVLLLSRPAGPFRTAQDQPRALEHPFDKLRTGSSTQPRSAAALRRLIQHALRAGAPSRLRSGGRRVGHDSIFSAVLISRAFAVLLAFSFSFLVAGCDLHPGAVDDIVHSDTTIAKGVETLAGPIVGAASAAGQAFLGIPYAAPPVGDLRWRAPQPVAAWTTPRPAIELGPTCLQNLSLRRPGRAPRHRSVVGSGGLPHAQRLRAPPAAAAGQGRPVMVWIHGGALVLGSSGQYDPSVLARNTGNVVVTINYRLGALGFLAHPALRGHPWGGRFRTSRPAGGSPLVCAPISRVSAATRTA